MSTHLTIQTDTDQRAIRVPPDRRQATISDLLRRENLPLNTRCGGRGLCEGCLVQLVAGTLVHRATGRPITANAHPLTLRGCEYRPAPDASVTLRLPARSLLRYAPQVVTTFRLNIPAGHDPLVDNVLPGDVGLAIDVGTTTVVALVVDLSDGRVLASASAFNRQMHLGDDVLTRINLCATDPANLLRLQDAIVRQTLTPLIADALQQAPGRPHRVRVAAIAANTTMLHLLAGVNPTPLGVAPFTPAFLEHRLVDIRIPGLPDDVPIHLLPGCSAYIGADLAAGIVATGQLYDDAPSLLVDIGTNGEIILKHNGHLYGASTAAGPAFEGAGLTFGLRAGEGAISHLRIHPDPLTIETDVIGDTTPTGICGTAYVDFLAQGMAAGILSPTGRLQLPRTPDRPARPGQAGPWDEHGAAFCIATGRGQAPIVISERDVARLLQAKAAIAAGILTLLRRAAIEPHDIRTLHLAGGFGLHIDRANAIACGLLPGFAVEQIEVVGNTSLGGAYLALLDRSLLADFERARTGIEIVELNLDPDFESTYIDQLMLA